MSGRQDRLLALQFNDLGGETSWREETTPDHIPSHQSAGFALAAVELLLASTGVLS
jgi:hypothetical protein